MIKYKQTKIISLSIKKLLLVVGVLGFGITCSAQNKPITHKVEIKRMKFIPANLSVKKGDTVVWINKDFYPHDVTDEKGKTWSSKQFGQNETWSKVITKDEYYFCDLHKTMKGTIRIRK
ncbi:cupredoxin domain-containing protein [Marixanthomonas sp. SCSIO 43207]|uniref:plastocyanin/azurin family copper-binding protein n=1 Tax=Marixanthomonas sp. SCSIO 43207 TaxID=2779360 RepID=UPI001CA7BF37|nr:plastocyanin/azurin family copper-binding protein [Marixanthomonas sp. SCSIO 43207]UAB82398.1 cupredoxin domain-containing protein [Marixanthomonas sp. SCSIO 43207]